MVGQGGPTCHNEPDLATQSGLDLAEDELVEERGGLHSEQALVWLANRAPPVALTLTLPLMRALILSKTSLSTNGEACTQSRHVTFIIFYNYYPCYCDYCYCHYCLLLLLLHPLLLLL